MFGGVPATAAIARTAVNVRAGASSRTAAAVHALVLALFVAVGAGAVAAIPLPALAGVLLATTVRMVDPSTIRGVLRSTRGDAATLALTFGVTVAVDLVTAVAVGVVLAMAFALRTIAHLLVPGGAFAISMVEADIDDFAIPFIGTTIRVSGFLREDLREVVEAEGFDIVEETSYSYAPASADVPPEVQIFLRCKKRD